MKVAIISVVLAVVLGGAFVVAVSMRSATPPPVQTSVSPAPVQTVSSNNLIPYNAKLATGVIKGVATFEGEVPKRIKIDVTERSCCGNGIPQLFEERFVVNADKKLANVVVYVSKGHERFDYSAMKLPSAQIAIVN